MAKVRVMYWKEIPVQVQAEDDSETISMELEPRFQQAADAMSMIDGSAGSDEYLDGWTWGHHFEVSGNASQASKSHADMINSKMPKDFVKRISNLFKQGNRITTPGSIDHWLEE